MQKQTSEVGNITVCKYVQLIASMCNVLLQPGSARFLYEYKGQSTTVQWYASAKTNNNKKVLFCYTCCDSFYIFMKTAFISSISDV